MGLGISPSEVRLHPLENDRYQWIIDDANIRFFEKNLSDMSTNMYGDLCNAVRSGEIRAVANGNHFNQDSPRTMKTKAEYERAIEGLEIEIQSYRRKESNLLLENSRLRKILSGYSKRNGRIGKSLMETGLRIQELMAIKE